MAQTIITTLRLIGQRAYIQGARTSAEAIKGIGRASNETTSGMKLLSGSSSILRSGLAAVTLAAKTTAIGLGAMAVAAGKVGLEFRASIEDAQVGMTTLLHGNEKLAKTTVDAVTTYAKNAPKLNVADAVKSTQMLIGAGMKAKNAVPTMSAFSDTLSAMGRDPEALQRITYAFVQMMSKGQISAEELRGQLGEIFPASKLLAKGMGISMKELQARMKEGSLRGGKYVRILLREMHKEFKGGTERSARTFNGMLNNIRENAKVTLGKVFEPLFFSLRDKIFPWVQKIGGQIDKWAQGGGPKRLIAAVKQGFTGAPAKIPRIKGRRTTGMDVQEAAKKSPLEQTFFNIAKVAGKVFPQIAKYAKQFIDALKPAQPFLEHVIWPLVKGFGEGLVAGIIGLIPLIKGFAKALGWIGNVVHKLGLEKWLERIGFLIGFVFGPGKLGIFRPFGAAFKFIGEMFAKIWPKIAGGARMIWPIVQSVFGFAKGAAIGFIRVLWRFMPVIGKVIGRFVGLYIKVVTTWAKIQASVFGAVGRIIARIASFGAKIVASVAKAVWKILGYFGSLGKKIAGKVTGGISAVVGAFASFGAAIGKALGDAIWGALPGPIKKLLSATGGVLKGAWEKISGGNNKKPAHKATGGMTTGLAIVGERGPELAEFPARTFIHSNASLARRDNSLMSPTIVVHSHLNWRGREVALAVAGDTEDRKARR